VMQVRVDPQLAGALRWDVRPAASRDAVVERSDGAELVFRAPRASAQKEAGSRTRARIPDHRRLQGSLEPPVLHLSRTRSTC